MASTLTDVDQFDATIQVPSNGELGDANDITEKFVQRLANRTFYNKTRITELTSRFSGVATDSGELIYVDGAGDPDPQLRTTRITAFGMKPVDPADTISEGTEAGSVLLQTNSATYYAPIRLPYGAAIQTLRTLVLPGAARTGANRVQSNVYHRTGMDFSSPNIGTFSSLGSLATDDTTASLQVITKSSIFSSVVSHPLFVAVRAGNTAASANDTVYGFEIDWLDPGPRNF